MHKNYNKQTIYNNDIALLQLKTKIKFKSDNRIAPICLPLKTAGDFANSDATVTGWGVTSAGNLKYILTYSSAGFCKNTCTFCSRILLN